MPLEEITLALFTACNSVRVVAYLPQIPQGGDRQERRVFGLVHDLDAVPAGAPVHRRLRARQSVRLGVGGLLLDQRYVLRCHIGGGVSDTPDTREAVDGSASSFCGGLIRSARPAE